MISCKTTVPTLEVNITPFAEIVPLPIRPVLVDVKTAPSEALKNTGINLASLASYSESLEKYIIWQDNYYLKVFKINEDFD